MLFGRKEEMERRRMGDSGRGRDDDRKPAGGRGGSDGGDREKPDLSGMPDFSGFPDFSGLDFSGLDFSGMDFSGMDPSNVRKLLRLFMLFGRKEEMERRRMGDSGRGSDNDRRPAGSRGGDDGDRRPAGGRGDDDGRRPGGDREKPDLSGMPDFSGFPDFSGLDFSGL